MLVIGAQGVLGSLMVGAFREAGWTVRSGARRPRAGQIQVDLDRPASIAAVLQDDEVVINTVPHAALHAERHVLEHGGALINVSALPAAAARSLRAIAGGARGTVLMNAGLAPGVTTIVAADLLRLHPAAGELEIVYTLSSTTPRGAASADFIRRGLTTMPHHRTMLVPLPRPFGERRCLGFGEGDAGWLGGIAEGRVIRQYVCIAEPSVHERLLELNRAAAMTKLPRALIGPRNPAIKEAPSDEPVAHWIAAIRGGRRLSARTVECRGDFLQSARSTVVFAEALLGQERAKGCLDPEEVCTLSGVVADLSAAGITIVPQ